MTIIAWDGKRLAADKRATHIGNPSTTTKIFRLRDGSIGGMSGDADTGRALIQWYNEGSDPTKFPVNRDSNGCCHAVLLIITPDKTIHQLQRTPFLITFEDKFAALGSGRDYALAAMYLGCNAIEAVNVATALDVDCGNGVDVLELL